MNLDDPNLTAYALDELAEGERVTIEKYLAQSPEAQAFVRQTQQMAGRLRKEFAAELEDAAKKPLNIMPLPMPRSFWSDARWSSISLAAVIAVAAVIAAVLLTKDFHPQNQAAARKSELVFEFVTEPAPSAEFAGTENNSGDNPFRSAKLNPSSIVPLNFGRASYDHIRRQLAAGTKPRRESVRLEELINNFAYDYPAPKSDAAFALRVATGGCPWQSQHRLVRIAIKAHGTDGRRSVIARDVSLAVNFDPESVESYRLLGYEDRATQTHQTSDNGDFNAGQTATVLYEVALVEKSSGPPKVSAILNYAAANTGIAATVASEPLDDFGDDFAQAPADFRFAAAVAEFGMILRDSTYKGDGTLTNVLAWSNESKDHDASGDRAEFIELVRKAQSLPL